jgi:hypothetical protein
MQSIAGIQEQIIALVKVRNVLLSANPTDLVDAQQVSNDIIGLSATLTSLMSTSSTMTDPPAAIAALQGAINQLNSEIAASAATTQIMASATVIMNQ